jgi:hypothetical protein
MELDGCLQTRCPPPHLGHGCSGVLGTTNRQQIQGVDRILVAQSCRFTGALVAGDLRWVAMGAGGWAMGREQNTAGAQEEEETDRLDLGRGWEKKEAKLFFNGWQL